MINKKLKLEFYQYYIDTYYPNALKFEIKRILSTFNSQPLSMQWGLWQEFYDSIYISMETHKDYDVDYDVRYNADVEDVYKSHKTRVEAIKESLKMAESAWVERNVKTEITIKW